MMTHPANRCLANQLPTWGLCICLALLASGCGTQGSTLETAALGPRSGTDAPTTIDSARYSIDAGVVLADRPGYFCVPLERVALNPDNPPVSLTSSCECVQPSLARYIAPDGSEQRAIFLEYVRESIDSHDVSSANASEPNPVSLGVLIEVELADGSDHDFTANMLHTVLAKGDKTEWDDK